VFRELRAYGAAETAGRGRSSASGSLLFGPWPLHRASGAGPAGLSLGAPRHRRGLLIIAPPRPFPASALSARGGQEPRTTRPPANGPRQQGREPVPWSRRNPPHATVRRPRVRARARRPTPNGRPDEPHPLRLPALHGPRAAGQVAKRPPSRLPAGKRESRFRRFASTRDAGASQV